jgi:hypothetical protein
MMDTPRVPNANNPTSKQVMQTKVQTHKKKTRGNTPGALPLIICPNVIEQLTEPTVPSTKHLRIMASHTKQAKAGNVVMPRQSTHLRGLKPSAHVRFCNSRIISQEAINLLLTDDINNDLTKIYSLQTATTTSTPAEPCTLCNAHGPPRHRQNHHELQKAHERSCHTGNLDDGVWKRLWRDELG